MDAKAIKGYRARLNKTLWFVEFNDCFIIRTLFFLSKKDVKSLTGSSGNRSVNFTQGCGFNYAWAEYYLQQNTYLKVIIFRSRGRLSANEKEGKKHWMINAYGCRNVVIFNNNNFIFSSINQNCIQRFVFILNKPKLHSMVCILTSWIGYFLFSLYHSCVFLFSTRFYIQ